MFPLPIRDVAERLSIREFLKLCEKLDDRERQYTTFRVLEITRGEALTVIVRTTTGKEMVVTL